MSNEQEIKKSLRLEIGMKLGREKPDRITLESLAETVIKKKYPQLDEALKTKIIASICDDFLGLGPLQKLMDDPDITEIMINGPSQVYIEKHGKKILSNERFDNEDHVRNMVEKMMGASGRRLDESSPWVDFSLDDGSRVNAIIPPLAVDGTTVTIRKFLDTITKLDNLIQFGTIDEKMAEFLKLSIKGKLNIMFSGATGSGKTSTLSVLSNEITEGERIVTLEDALELNLFQAHVVRLLTRPENIEGKGEVTLRDLFTNTLRMRATRIIIGEIRGEEAMDYLQAVNSGHDGTLAVLHASTPADSIGRLETMSMYSGLNIPSKEIRRQISSGLDIILQHEQLADGTRKITYITEVGGLDGDEIVLNDIFRYEMDHIDENGKVHGSFITVNKPRLKKFEKRGIDIDKLGIFA